MKEQGLLQEKDAWSGRQKEGGEDRREAQREARLSELRSWYLSGCKHSPDGVPHVEPVQRLRAVGAPSCQAHKCWQPIRYVDELVADRPRLLQQRAGDEPDSPDPSFPQGPLPSSQWPVASTGQRLTSVIWGENVTTQEIDEGF